MLYESPRLDNGFAGYVDLMSQVLDLGLQSAHVLLSVPHGQFALLNCAMRKRELYRGRCLVYWHARSPERPLTSSTGQLRRS